MLSEEDWKLDTFLKDEVINPIDFYNFKARLQGPSSSRPEQANDLPLETGMVGYWQSVARVSGQVSQLNTMNM